MSRSDAKRVRVWRRRVLQRRGAQLHAALTGVSRASSLAMLDETGVVVSWYGQVGAGDEHVVDRHVSQFYVPEEIVRGQPLRDLHSAAVGGSTIRQGWRRDTGGRTYWGSVVIEALVLRDGRLQGFSYVSRECGGPDAPISARLPPSVACLPVLAEGFLSRSGDDWQCERGINKDDAACDAVQLPANAHLDYSGGKWTCDEGFHAHGGRCVAD